jgi:tetratricopeptide (TPR) repeat protein
LNRRLLFFQLLLTLFILAFADGNALKACLLLPLWWLSFGTLSRNEVVVFLVVNAVFVVSDIAAIRNGFFQFTHPDVLALPYYEFLMWGFYLLHTHRVLQVKYPASLDLKVLVLAGVFSALFAVMGDRHLLLFSSSAVLLLGFVFYHEKEDGLFSTYMMLLAAVFESVGITRGLWSYPGADLLSASAQFVVMWGAAGLFMRRIAGPWLAEPSLHSGHVYQSEHLPLHDELANSWLEAQDLRAHGMYFEAWCRCQKVEAASLAQVLPLNYPFCVEAAEMATLRGYARKGIELYRKALKLASTPSERAEVYIRLCRLYRIMIRMENARYELRQAFNTLDIEYPRASAGALLRSAFSFVASFARRPRPPSTPDDLRRLEVSVALYEEAGLSAYYYGEYVPLIQCMMNPRALAFRIGPSKEMVNWFGGSACVLSLLGLHKAADSLLDRADRMSEKLGQRYPIAKALVWRALTLDYAGYPVKSAESFSRLVAEFHTDLQPHDVRLAATTLSVNLMLRGHMAESSRAIESLFVSAVDLKSSVFSCTRTFIEWYRVPALSFCGRDDELREIINNSKAIFSSLDVETWQVTQFLGGLLIYYYTREDPPLEEIKISLKRFESLHLSPRATHREACYYWVGKAYILVELFHTGKVSERQARRALAELGRTPPHPSLQAHCLLLTAKLERYKNPDAPIHSSLSQALTLAEEHDNDWVRFEVYALQSRERALNLARSKGWQNRIDWLERSAP